MDGAEHTATARLIATEAAGPENVPSGTEAKLHSSVDRCVAKDVNVASSGYCTNMDDPVSAEQCIENADVPLNTVERVAEERVASACAVQSPVAATTEEGTESDPEIKVVYEKLQQPRTVSRDSGYSTPSPMVGNFSAKDNQEVVDVEQSSRECAVCGRKTETMCSGCSTAYYCGTECQLEDWNATHHLVCCASLVDS